MLPVAGLAICWRTIGMRPASGSGLGGSADSGRRTRLARADLASHDASSATSPPNLFDAARIYGPQKGARPEDIPVLTQRLSLLGLPRGPRTGAAGGLGAKLASLGAELVDRCRASPLTVLGFEAACRGCEAVVTARCCLDVSPWMGKLPVVVAHRAHALGLPVLGHFGCKARLGTGGQAVRSGQFRGVTRSTRNQNLIHHPTPARFVQGVHLRCKAR